MLRQCGPWVGALVFLSLAAGPLPAAEPPRPDHLRLWLDAGRRDSMVTDESGRVAKWKDRSGGGHHALQRDPERRPALVEAALNGMPVVRFDGGSFLDVPSIRDEEGGVWAFVVSRRSADQASDRKWQRLLSCWVPSVRNDRTLPGFQLPAGERGSGAAYGPTIDRLALGGARIGPLTVGANRQHRSGRFRGELAEVLIYDGGLNDPEKACAVEEYLAAKWGAGVSREDRGWTRVGPLGRTPERTTDALPLSDEQNEGDWKAYEPLTDEFEGGALDTGKWMPRHPRWRGRQPAFFNPRNVEVRDGRLRLTMRKQEVPEKLRERGYHDYSSACVHARDTVKYGYFEVRARPMNSAGSSSFWFRNSTADRVTEIDVFEIGGRAPGFERKFNMNLHVVRTPTEKKHWSCGGAWIAPWDLADDYHVYALEWSEERIRHYVDGVVVRSVPNTHWHQPLYMIFDSETMPDWFGMPEDADLPSTYSIDYVRAWKRK